MYVLPAELGYTNVTRKQIQMHMVAKVIAQKMTKKCKGMDIFKSNFSYDEAFFSELENEPITVENFVEGDFTKYVTNDGNSCVPDVGKDAIFEQAEALVHFSFEDSSKKLLLLDIQGSGYKLYDPEIATADDLSSDSDENYFCAQGTPRNPKGPTRDPQGNQGDLK